MAHGVHLVAAAAWSNAADQIVHLEWQDLSLRYDRKS
jgi:hypothetical protein